MTRKLTNRELANKIFDGVYATTFVAKDISYSHHAALLAQLYREWIVGNIESVLNRELPT